MGYVLDGGVGCCSSPENRLIVDPGGICRGWVGVRPGIDAGFDAGVLVCLGWWGFVVAR